MKGFFFSQKIKHNLQWHEILILISLEVLVFTDFSSIDVKEFEGFIVPSPGTGESPGPTNTVLKSIRYPWF